MRRTTTAVCAGVLALALGACGSGDDGGAAETPPAEVEPAEVEAPPAEVEPAEAEAPAEGTIPGDGTFRVGADIEPGTYISTGPASDVGFPCYWERLSGTSGDFDDIIANGTPTGQAVVTIDATDVAFSTNGCHDWVRE